MLPAEFLEDENFNTIREKAVQRIAGYQTDWTNYNTADSGIALLELFAWMQEMQQFYLKQGYMENEILYQDLLGIKPGGLEPASVTISLENEQEEVLYSNTGFYRDRICYEPIQTETVGAGKLCKCYAQTAKGVLLWQWAGGQELPGGVWMFGEHPAAGDCFYMGFHAPFRVLRRYSVYIDLLFLTEEQRNPAGKEARELFSRYEMECWNGYRWCRCKVLRDETAGFIQSGFLDWMPEQEQEKVEELYWLRFRLLSSQYDLPPRLAALDSHQVKLLQKETIAASVEVLLPVSSEGNYSIDIHEYFDTPAEPDLFIKQGEVYQRIHNWNRENNQIKLFYQGGKEQLLTVLLVVHCGNQRIPLEWEATGFPDQIICMEDDHIMGSRLQVLIEDEENSEVYRFWNPVSHFWGCSADDPCYCYQEAKGILQFGNGIHGRIPEGRILITDCIRTLGTEGRIKEGKQLIWRRGKAYNPTAAQGGHGTAVGEEDRERFWQQEKNPRRAVTLEDYERLVMQTPGLLIKRVRAISRKDQNNCITLVVEGGSSGNGRGLHPVYRREIRRWLEGKRLMGTRLRLEAPDYIPIHIRVEVRIYERYQRAEQWIRETLEDYVRVYMKGFGAALNYSHLYGTLDSLSCVREICTLTVHAAGKGIQFMEDGGFQLPEQALAVIEEIQIQFAGGIRGR